MISTQPVFLSGPASFLPKLGSTNIKRIEIRITNYGIKIAILIYIQYIIHNI
jgi:hypothetical protein